MSSNESVERMLKQLENLLRQQDKGQGKETEAGLEPVAAEGGSPGPSEEQAAGDLPPAPVVEATDEVVAHAPVDETPESPNEAAGDPVPAGMLGAQGLQVETVSSPAEDGHEIGGPEVAEAEGELPVAASPPEAPVVGEDEPDDAEDLPHVRRRFGIGELLKRSTRDNEQVATEESTVQEAPVPDSTRERPADLVAEPHQISTEGPLVVPDEMREPSATTDALSASGSLNDTDVAELSISAEGFNAESEAEPVRHEEDVPDNLRASADSEALTEAGEDAESPTSKYPSWWFRGGSVHELEGGDDIAASNGGGELGATDDHGSGGPGVGETTETEAHPDRRNVEPFVHRDPVVGPSPERKLISEQLQEEELVAGRHASAESEAEEFGETPGKVMLGIEGLNAVPVPSDAVPDEEPDVVEYTGEDEADVARALKIVESLAEVMAPREVDVVEEVGAAEEPAPVEEVGAAEEPAPVEEVGAAEEPAPVKEVEAAEESAPIEEAGAAEAAAHLDEVPPVAEDAATEEPAPIEESGAAEEIAHLDEFAPIGEDAPTEESADTKEFDSAEEAGAVEEFAHTGEEAAAEEPMDIEEVGFAEEFGAVEEVAPVGEDAATEEPADTEDVGAADEVGASEDFGAAEEVAHFDQDAAREDRLADGEGADIEEDVAPDEDAHVEDGEALPAEVLQPEGPQEKPSAPEVDSTSSASGAISERPRRRLTARLGTLLLDAHLISGRDLDRALEEHQVSGERLGHYLVDKGMVDEKDLAGVLSAQYGVPAADVEDMVVPAAVLMCIPEKMARRHMVLPLAVSEGDIEVAMLNPSDITAIKDIEFTTGLRAQTLIVTEWALERAIDRLYSGDELRSALLSGGSAKSTGLKDPKAIIRRMVRDRDETVMQSERDPQSAYELAASIDDFVDEILKTVEKPQD